MSIIEILLKLLPIVALSFGSIIDSSDEELTRSICPQVDSSLNLTGVGFGEIPDGFVKNKFLTELILDENQIPVVSSETFTFVPKLIHLSLANNLLQTLDLEPFSELNDLKTLILNGNCKSRHQQPRHDPHGHTDPWSNYYTTTPRSDYYEAHECNLKINPVLPSLTHLYVENNNIQQLSVVGFGRLPALTHLHLSHNPIAMNEETMLALKRYAPALKHLFLKGCGLIRLDASKLPTVTSLHLDENHITIICNEYCLRLGLNLNSAIELTNLSISHNQVARIEVDSFKDTTNLVTLDLSHNQILSIAEGTFNKLLLLEYLNLENNKFTRMSAVHISGNLARLKSLALGDNNIMHVSNEDFINMPTLETLTLNNNDFSFIESGTFSNLTNLKELSLAGNQLERIPNDLMPISNSLITLDLSNNKFTSSEYISLDNVPNLVSLFLKNNPLTNINANWLEAAGENLTIFVGNTCP